MSKEEFPSEKNLDEKENASTPKDVKKKATEGKEAKNDKHDEKLAKELADLKDKNKELEDKYLRSEAEIQNMQNRYSKERAQLIKYESQSLAKDILPAVDNLERALSVEADDDVSKQLKKGVKMTLDSLTKALKEHGIVEIEAEDVKFDPTLHQAVQTVAAENDDQKDHVVQVLQKGYQYGTTNSAVAVLEGKEPKIITNPEGNRTTPSVVAFKDGEIQVGEVAKRQAITNPNTIVSIKRHMGEADYKVKVGDKEYTPQEISAFILQYIKKFSEDYLGEKVTDAVITVPAYFNDAQRQATKDAGKIAGLNVQRIINEPTASALAFGLNKDQDEKVLVYDLGGGTFDVSVLQLGDGVFQVLSTNGDTHLGGDDFDNRIMDWLIKNFKDENGVDLSKDKMAMQRLKDAAEKAKKDLSGVSSTHISLPFISAGEAGPLHLEADLTRAKFDELTSDLVEKTKVPFDNALKDAGLTVNDIDKVILNGGSTRIPAVQKAVKEWAGKEPDHSINPDEAVALGAAIQGGVISGDVKDIVLLDVTPLSLGIETMGGVFTKLIDRNTTIPTSKSQIFSTAADNQPAVDVHVLQGERPMAADDKTLGRFELTDIPPAPRGVPQIQVTFDIDKNGIVNVSAKDMGTGKEQKITIKSSSGLSDEEIKRMQKDAEEHAEEDKKRKEEVDLRNEVDQLIFTTDKTLKDTKDKLSDSDRKPVEDALEALKKAQKDNNLDEMKEKKDALSKAAQDLAVKLYQQNSGAQGAAGQAGPQGPQNGPQGGNNGGAQDGEFHKVDPNK